MSEEIKPNRYRVLGINDDKDFCECCNKQHLKKVVWIEDMETDTIKHFGSVCAVRNFISTFKNIEFSIREQEKVFKKLLTDISDAKNKIFFYRNNRQWTKEDDTPEKKEANHAIYNQVCIEVDNLVRENRTYNNVKVRTELLKFFNDEFKKSTGLSPID